MTYQPQADAQRRGTVWCPRRETTLMDRNAVWYAINSYAMWARAIRRDLAGL